MSGGHVRSMAEASGSSVEDVTRSGRSAPGCQARTMGMAPAARRLGRELRDRGAAGEVGRERSTGRLISVAGRIGRPARGGRYDDRRARIDRRG